MALALNLNASDTNTKFISFEGMNMARKKPAEVSTVCGVCGMTMVLRKSLYDLRIRQSKSGLLFCKVACRIAYRTGRKISTHQRKTPFVGITSEAAMNDWSWLSGVTERRKLRERKKE